MMYLFQLSLYLIIAFVSTQFCLAQRAASAVKTEFNSYSDSTRQLLPAEEEELHVEVRIVSDSKIEQYKKDPDFFYDENPEEPDDWITRFRNWINEQIANLESSRTYSVFIDYLYYGLMVIALFLIVRGLIKADRRGLLFGKMNNQKVKLVDIDEDINELDFDSLIDSSIHSKNYKLAVRYLFLKSLKLLSQKGMIELRNNKTNYQYISEIKHNNIADTFRGTTLLFEWIWYGDFPVDETIMQSSQKDFNYLYVIIKS